MPWPGYRFSGRSWVAEFGDLGGNLGLHGQKPVNCKNLVEVPVYYIGNLKCLSSAPNFLSQKLYTPQRKRRGRKAHFPIALANAMFKVWGCIPDLL